MKILATLALNLLTLHGIPPLTPTRQPVSVQVRVQDSADIVGYYACTGKAPSGKSYDGVVLLERVGETYLVTWSTGGTTTLGVGTRINGLLCVGWKLGEQVGVTVYREHGRNLDGLYQTVPGNGHRHPERLTWLRALPPVEREGD